MTSTSKLAAELEEAIRIAVIVPVYGHPVLLGEAIESVLAQDCEFRIVILIVSDGCLMSETDLICSAYALAHRNVLYFRRPNGGPSAARNYAIDYVIESCPTVKAVYFLDADNRLTPTALGDAYRELANDSSVGWVYPNIDSFGINWTGNYGIPYSPLLHVVHDNICDTGSLVSKAVLLAGARFDEDARNGYEDWDFWLQCLSHGFVGKHVPFGFAYRQRPESRYREMNRRRGATIEHLRRRHWSVAAPRNLLRWEHETNPRYLYTFPREAGSSAFTDPTERSSHLCDDIVVEQFYSACHQPDEFLLWPYFVAGHPAALDTLAKSGLIHGAFALMEREADKSSFVALTFGRGNGEVAVNIGQPADRTSLHLNTAIWMCRSKQMQEIVRDKGDSWAKSLSTSWPEPPITEIRFLVPDFDNFNVPPGSATEALISLFDRLRSSPMRTDSEQRWNWRPQHFPSRETYYQCVCNYLGVTRTMPRLAKGGLDIGVVVPIASFGGAEKVAYAMAAYLQNLGAQVHLFILGQPRMKVISEYRAVFQSVNFLADPDFPTWGGPLTVLGQECFPSDSNEVMAPTIAGLLVNLDFIVNCHSAPLNSVMGTLRSQHKTKTATYLHVFDTTPLGRSVGHPYLAVSFEHAYDLILTCSRQLAEHIHALGVPSSKILSIQNSSGFSISEDVRKVQSSARSKVRGLRKFRVLYLGRLDPQKGVERLVATARKVAVRGLPVDIRVIGAGLMEEGVGWAATLGSFGVSIEAPLYDSDSLAAAYAWADVLLLPSRWEGAPLVIAESHQLGCIPIATNVGAVGELTTHDVDGFLVESVDDESTAEAMVSIIERLVSDDAKRCRMAEAALRRAENNKWNKNFAPLGDWVSKAFKAKRTT